MHHKHEDITHQGYLMQTDIVPVDPTDTREPDMLLDTALPQISMDYLARMQALCEQYGAELVLIKSPTNSVKYYWYDEWDEQVRAYAQANNLTYYNFIGMDDELGLDWQTDTYDGGVHLNVYGAEKLSEYFGAILTEAHAIPDRRTDTAQSERWHERVEAYEQQKKESEK